MNTAPTRLIALNELAAYEVSVELDDADTDIILAYASELACGGTVDPIQVTPVTGHWPWMLEDGLHRLNAHLLVGATHVAAVEGAFE
jgi:hypothetical protein